MQRVGDGWQVGWFEHTLANPAFFAAERDAAAFLLGKVLLDAEPPRAAADGGARQLAAVPPQRVETEREDSLSSPSMPPPDGGLLSTAKPEGEYAHDPDEAYQPGTDEPLGRHEGPNEPAANEQDSAASAADAPPSEIWRQWARPGEPPPELFQGKRFTGIPEGTELDRFGTPDGNLTYVAGTPYEQRSLPPEWAEREYHRYRLARETDALTGIPVPWFSQPGGGTAYLLAEPVGTLLDAGVLEEVPLDEAEDPAVGFRARTARE
jgi:hypothetical protein